MSGVLLVTDSKEVAGLVKRALRETSARLVAECNSPRAAADAYAKSANALVILDMFLPESSGIEVLKNLKKINETGSFVILTRIRTRAMIERSFRMGAQDVMEYPVSQGALRDTILHRLKSLPADAGNGGGEPGDDPAPKPARKK